MSNELGLGKVRDVTMYVTNGVCVGRQYGFWYDTKPSFIAVPSRMFGLVAVVPAGVAAGSAAPLFGWIVYRPRALDLVFPADTRVRVKSADRLVMQDWCRETLPWRAVKMIPR